MIGAWPDGTPFYSMRMVDGRTLRDAINAARTLSARLALLPAVIAAAEAMAFAHSQRVIHRDLTPANVLVGAYGETVVIDWGLAKDLSSGENDVDDVNLTGVGAVIGTPTYMPPEQAHAQSVDERADVYALGAILYQLLSGVAPFDGRTAAAILRAVKAGPPPPLENAPLDLISIVNKAMARDPDHRYPSARELSEELKRFQTGRLVEAHAYSTRERARRFIARHRGAVTATALAMIMLAVVATVSVTRVVRSRAIARVTAQELLLEKGRAELLGGNPLGALAYLDAAAKHHEQSPALAFLVGAAARATQSSTLLDCEGYPYGVAISPDGTQLVAACQDHGKVWRLGDHTMLRELGGGSGDFYGVAFGGELSRDGTLAISCGVDRIARVWDATASSRLILPLAGHTDVIRKCVFDASGTHALTTGHDGRANVWDLATGALLVAVEHGDILTAAHFAPDGRRFITIGIDGRVNVWDARSGALLASVDARRGKDAQFLPDGRGLVVQRGDGRIELFADITNQAAAFSPASDVTLIAASADGTRVIGKHDNGRLKIWDTATARELTTPSLRSPVVVASRAPILAASGESSIEVVDLTTGAARSSLPFTGAALAISADGSRLGVRLSTRASVRPPDILSDAVEIWELALSPVKRGVVPDAVDVLLSADGRRTVARTGAGAVFVWDVDAGARLASLSDEARAVGFALRDERVVVLETFGTAEQQVAIYASHGGALITREPATAAHVDPSGRWVTVIRPGGIVRTLSVDDGAVHTEFAAEQLVDAQIDATGGLVAAIGEYGKSALVLNAQNGRLLARWPIEVRDWCTVNFGMRSENPQRGSTHRSPQDLRRFGESAGLRLVELRSSFSIYGELGAGWMRPLAWPLRALVRLVTLRWRRASHTLRFVAPG